MTALEKGFLLLTSHLGDPDRKVLSAAQLRSLAQRVRNAEAPGQDRELCESDLTALGYNREMARRILRLLNEEDVLRHYVSRGKNGGCIPVTRVSEGYPLQLRQRLGMDSPGCLWAKGDVSFLGKPAIALVGSRELMEPNREFAREVGYQAAMQGLTLVSGNARGADREAQESCLAAGGRVISIVADELRKLPIRKNVLYLSEEDYDAPFSSQRALSRNRCIHALADIVFVAQSTLGKGGTWDGSVKNLRFGWSTVVCFRDGSEASRQLEQMGAYLIDKEQLADFQLQISGNPSFF